MQHINLNSDNKYFLEFRICKKSNSELNNYDCDFNVFKMPNFYLDKAKPESVLGYKLLYYLYFKKFNKYLDTSEIILDDNNKPRFGNNINLYFNISHSKNFVACVLSNFEVGLDIEEERTINPNACKRFITSHDYNYMRKHNYFEVQVWNIKEAYAKYLGLGLRINFKDVYVKNIINNYNTIVNNFYIENRKIFLAICFNKSIKLN